ncbi:MAG: PD-(D/E)XK nuclease family protein [Hydrogenophilaceae bacterium]|nr:PD-(D/E)XK nuclease family protein [Hydrogenophilaceae bacterium]
MEIQGAPANDLFGAAARLLRSRHSGARAADFSATTVLVPNLHAAQGLYRALAAETKLSALIPPRTLTIPAWTAAAPLPPAQAESPRMALLYQSLRNWRRFEERLLWPMCAELLSLFDELTHHRVSLPDTAEDFSRQLVNAYASRNTRALDFESRLLHDSWFALTGTGSGPVDAATRHVKALAWLAEHHQGPLYVLGVMQFSPAECDCLERIASREPVVCMLPDAGSTETGRLLQAAWSTTSPMLERAQALQASSPSALALRLFPANSLEEEALAASAQVRLWLAAGKRRIIVVAQDRLTARRTRALLERADVLVEDETGWPLSTTAAASVVMRWIEAIANDFNHEGTLDLLKSPYTLNTWPDGDLHEGTAQLEMQLRKDGPAPGLTGLSLRARQSGSMHAQNLITTLQRAAQPLSAIRLPLAGWCLRLRESLKLLDMDDSLRQDEAGRQLLDELAQRVHELQADDTLYHFGEWRRWLTQQWENTNFVDHGVESPVVFTHLAATRCRPADALLILGADAARLPSPPAASPFFNQRVRAVLGLPDMAEQQAQAERDLLQLLASGPDALITWRAQQNGEQVPPSPWFARLETFCKLAWGRSLVDTGLRDAIAPTALAASETQRPQAGMQPRPTLAPHQVPQRISPSGYNQLVACPYQYFAARVLGLEELEDIETELDKRDYGETVHAILHRFHSQYPVLGDMPDDNLIQALHAISEAEFEKSGNGDYFALAWLRRWQGKLPGYLAWQRAREGRGWQWQSGEEKHSRGFTLTDGSILTLTGKLDRIDRKADEIAVLDYKTGEAQKLRKQLAAPGEDVQLPAYVLLLDQPVSEAAYVALDEAITRDISPPQDLAELCKDTGNRLIGLFNRLREAAPLPAQGAESACEFCAMRGLCRKDFWADD